MNSLHDVKAAVDTWLSDLASVVPVLLAVIMANLMDGDPLWLFLMAASGSGKTELLRALSLIPQVYALSNLMPQTLISGKDGTSLLLKLDKKILVLKDFGTVLSMHRDSRQEILAQLREVYDGTYVKVFGTGKVVRWSGKVGFIAGVTPIIDLHHGVAQVLGERFVQFRLAPSNGVAVAQAAMRHQGREVAMRDELANAFAGFFEGRAVPGPPADYEAGRGSTPEVP